MADIDLDEHDMWNEVYLSGDDERWLGHLTRNPQPEPTDYPSQDAYIAAMVAFHASRRRAVRDG
jgi:hypothetical protein